MSATIIKATIMIFLGLFIMNYSFASEIVINSYTPENYEITILNTKSQTFSLNASTLNGSVYYRWYIDNQLKYDSPIIEIAEDAFDLHAINFTDDFFIGIQDHQANGFTFNNDGTKL